MERSKVYAEKTLLFMKVQQINIDIEWIFFNDKNPTFCSDAKKLNKNAYNMSSPAVAIIIYWFWH